MQFALQNIEQLNKQLIHIISNTSLETINKIPIGFNNNIAWHVGHIATTNYSLAFKVTGVDINFNIPFSEKYKKGSKPETDISQDELNELINLLNTFSDAILVAAKAERFNNMTTYTTGTFGVPNTSIDEMLITIAMHYTLHFQSIKDYKKILETK